MQRIIRFILVTVMATALYPFSVAHMQQGTCTVSASSNVNKRTGPGMDYGVVGILDAGDVATVQSQTTGTDGSIWWQLESGDWVPSIDVSSSGPCDSVRLTRQCRVTVLQDVPLYSEPGSDQVVGALAAGELAVIIVSEDLILKIGSNPERHEYWYRLDNGAWLERDNVSTFLYPCQPIITQHIHQGTGGASNSPPETQPQDNQCRVSSSGTVNKRTGPGTVFPVGGTLAAGETATVSLQSTDTNGFVWWWVGNGMWVREDVVNETGDCASVLQVCAIMANQDLSLHSAPQSDDVVGTLEAGDGAYVVSIRIETVFQSGVGLLQETWYRLGDGTFILANENNTEYITPFCAEQTLQALPLHAYFGQVALPTPAPSPTQDSVDWTCDAGPDDVLNAAQIAYDAGDLDRALELALIAEELCGSSAAPNPLRYTQAVNLRNRIEMENRPTPIPDAARDELLSQSIALNNRGLELKEQGQYAEALVVLEEALVIVRQIDEQWGESIILQNLGDVYYAQGQYTAALDLYDQALTLMHEVDNHEGEEKILSNIGSMYSDQGRYAAALDYFTRALQIARESDNRQGEAAILNNSGAVYVAQGQHTAALNQFTQALAIVREIGDRNGEGTTLANIGFVYYEQGLLIDALDYYNDALALIQETHDRAGEGTIANNIGSVYVQQERYSEALDQFTQALAIARETDDRTGEGQALNNLGLVHSLQGQYAEAQDYYTQAIEIAHDLDARASEVGYLGNRAWVYEQLKAYDGAISDYKAAVNLIETVLSDAAIDSAIANLSSQVQNRNPYERLAILITREQSDHLNGFAYAERGTAILIRTDLTLGAIDFRSNSDDALIVKERSLRTGVDDAQRLLDSLRRDRSASNADIQNAQQLLSSARAQYDAHLQTMQLQGGFLARQISYAPASFLEITNALPDDTTLLSYVLGYEGIIIYALTPGRIASYTITIGQQNINAVAARFMSDRRANADALRELYDLVFAPIADEITTSRLIIVPDGPLNYVPFAALQAPDGTSLIDHYSISMVSSATTLVLLNDRAQQTHTAPTSPALVLAQPAAAGLPTLRNAPLEALEVADLLGVEPNLNASETDLRAGVTGSEVLYITAHAELDRFAPLFSVIHLGESGDYDGRLEVREIYELDLSQGTELVVLSGCETASGGDGEDFGLLTRAVFAAGTPRVVASLWSVDDAATADLMTAFIAERSSYDNDADALRAAMLATREQYPEPYYWASFVLSGLP